MTTTLRPTEPEQRTEGGGRARSYEVCVNSRPVGTIRLTTDARLGPAAGRLEHLRVDEAGRHRGRGTVAALAAEEVLRGWGCTQVVASVPASATTALGLATALGYRERGRNMVKPLTGAPALPDGSVIRSLTEAEYPAWCAHERADYVKDLVQRGLSAPQAEAKADRDYATLLPHGRDTAGAWLRVLVHDGADVGTLWVALRAGEADAAVMGEAYVFSVEVAEEHRGRGHGRTLMLAAEGDALAGGAHSLGLHVFGGNTPALRLYESLGYEPVEYQLFKPLL
ncbi:GNAT family N-acetyltransferase [Streptomyces sp. NEAU-Y11]|uniref:GNAT family N-acetyltransferase n=1 Tax=Streptomyces cucumeris TaxID=2962890 RepID=UPI0020C8849C|nr:GNAT family N-acetyltransferase [Streptomyces sp. NEAU-Y11]MCP9208070.1 GNAT family N-acetyltransferase [Streptomyces sp. NEAU-Y11]